MAIHEMINWQSFHALYLIFNMIGENSMCVTLPRHWYGKPVVIQWVNGPC